MPFYLIEQRGVPGERLVEGDKPQSAINHVINDAFTWKKVEGRDLIEAFKRVGDAEVAGAPVVEPEPEYGGIGDKALNYLEQDALRKAEPYKVLQSGEAAKSELDPDRQREDRDERVELQKEDDAARFPPGHDEFGPIDS